jgi:hypothetical protein
MHCVPANTMEKAKLFEFGKNRYAMEKAMRDYRL